MPVPFNSVPSNLRVPILTAEFDNTRANQGPALLPYRALLIGQKTSAGTATANTVRGPVTSADDVATLAGRGSLLHRQAMAWFDGNQSTETWIGVLADDGTGVAATADAFTVTGPATAAGTLALYIGGELVSVGVNSGDSASTIASAINAAVNAKTDLPVTSTVASNVVTVTFRHKGTAGNALDLRLNYGSNDAVPAGVGVTFAALATGATNPVLTSLIAAMGDIPFQIIVHPYTDSTSLTAIEHELASRFGPLRMIDGVAFTAANDTVANLGTLGNSRNSSHSVIVCTQNSPTPTYEYAANVAAAVALAAAVDPARPFQTLELSWVLAPILADQRTLQERNLLLYDGISTTKAVPGGSVVIERLITTYKTNTAGSPDTSYLDVTTMLTLLYLRYSFRNQMATRYPRAKLANDNARVGPGQAIITPKIGKAEAVMWFQDMAELGLVDSFDDFKANLVVERNAQDPNRLDFLLPPTLIGQFIVGAANIQFRL